MTIYYIIIFADYKYYYISWCNLLIFSDIVVRVHLKS